MLDKIWKTIVVVVTAFGLLGGIWTLVQMYEKFTGIEYKIEQTVDPETMERLRNLEPGEKITVEKGRPLDESRSDGN